MQIVKSTVLCLITTLLLLDIINSNSNLRRKRRTRKSNKKIDFSEYFYGVPVMSNKDFSYNPKFWEWTTPQYTFIVNKATLTKFIVNDESDINIKETILKDLTVGLNTDLTLGYKGLEFKNKKLEVTLNFEPIYLKYKLENDKVIFSKFDIKLKKLPTIVGIPESDSYFMNWLGGSIKDLINKKIKVSISKDVIGKQITKLLNISWH